ncbi:MAG: twin-arginine translocase subunit TatC [Candidatus Portiera sp.]|nr:twin-arginine translocase subunit TatC [Portiera sp.]
MSKRLPILEHLAELRRRFLLIIALWFGLFLLCAYFAADMYHLIALPLLAELPQGGNLVAVDVASPFIAPLKLAAFSSMLLILPVAFYQLWFFIAPGLYKKEKRLALPLLLSTILLFYVGLLFVYFGVMPLALSFFYRIAPEGVQIMTDINRYLSFVLRLAFAFGTAFELPLVILILVKSGLVSVVWLKANRSYVIVGCFVAAMLLTPPDIFSQILLAVPLCLLYEAGILLSGFGSSAKKTK